MIEDVYLMSGEDVIRLGKDIFKNLGMSDMDAGMLLQTLVDADMRGIKSHGCVRIPSYVEQFNNGRVNPKAEIEVLKETPTFLVLHGQNGAGSVISTKAAEMTRKKAKETGIAFTVIRGSNHFGAAGYWAEMLSGDDMIGFAATNGVPTLSAPETTENFDVIPGIGRATGSNPFAYAMPSEKYPPICLDICGGVMAQGKIYEYSRLKKPLPENAWMGMDGTITRDPNQYVIDDYIMIPYGLHKGFGAAVIMEMLTSALADTEFHGAFQGFNEKTPEFCHVLMAIRIDAFADLKKYKGRVDNFIEYLHDLPVRNEADKTYYPGEIEALLKAKCLKEGFTIPVKVLDDMIKIAQGFGVDTSYIKLQKSEG